LLAIHIQCISIS